MTNQEQVASNIYFSQEELTTLVERAKAKEEGAIEELCEKIEPYIHARIGNYFRKWGKSSDLGGAPINYIEDLYSAGFMGFLSAIQGFDPEKGKLLTYATHFIDQEIEKEGKKFRNPFGTGDTARLFKGRETKEKMEQDVWDALQEFEAKKHKKRCSFFRE